MFILTLLFNISLVHCVGGGIITLLAHCKVLPSVTVYVKRTEKCKEKNAAPRRDHSQQYCIDSVWCQVGISIMRGNYHISYINI